MCFLRLQMCRILLIAILFTVANAQGLIASPATCEQHPPARAIADNPLLSLSVVQARAFLDSMDAAHSVGNSADMFWDLAVAQAGLAKAADIIQTDPYGGLNGSTTMSLFAALVEARNS